MDRARLTRIEGAVFADCLFLIGQAGGAPGPPPAAPVNLAGEMRALGLT